MANGGKAMTADTVQTLIRTLADYDDQPAVVALQKHEVTTWSFAELVEHSRCLAVGLTNAGVQPGAHAVLYAPNSPEWILCCLALMTAAAVPVPLDAQMGDEDLQHVLDDTEAQWIFTTTRLTQRFENVRLPRETTVVLLDAEAEERRSWRHYLATRENTNSNHAVATRELPTVEADAVAVLFYTSGTTGKPKGVPLTHRNLMANLSAIRDLDLLHANDHLLLPLPLHHVYPFTGGMLTTLAVGASLVLPYALTGPQMIRALQEGNVTALIGVPRFFAALYAAVDTRIRQRGRILAALFSGVLGVSTALRRWCGLRLGQWCFAPLHKEFAPHLRRVASGGSALDPALGWTLEGLGWQVAIGYGLTETSPLLTFHQPGAGRLDTAGRPLPGVEIRIAEPQDGARYGEILAKGPNVFSGYHNLPEETQKAFTADGYFRTGDLGYFDRRGYLHLEGRASSLIVLPGGENIRPEDVEERLTEGPHIREAAVLQYEKQLVALIVPETQAQAADNSRQAEQNIRQDVEQQVRALPSHHRVSDYAITSNPLPRTRLGKIRRHKLAELYQQAQQQRDQPSAEAGPLPLEHMSPEDRQLLEDPAANHVWDWLVERFPDRRLTPQTNLQLDLDVDSLAWLNLTLEIRERTGVDLDEEAIGRIEIVRDLLHEAAEAEQSDDRGQAPLERLQQPETLLNRQQHQWLQPPGWWTRACGSLLYRLDFYLLRWVYQLEVKGQDQLPQHGPLVFTPNHVSLLDPMALGAALSERHRQRTYWGGWTGIMFTNPLIRLVSRAARVIPVDPRRGPLSSLAFAVAALQRDYNLVWFPEGGRSHTGKLEHFQAGIGLVLQAHPVPVVPVHISGTYEALPYGQWRPRVQPITVTFGPPINPDELLQLAGPDQSPERIASALHDQVAALN
ncbi:MAG: AMP-binding protein [Candidatus Binatia bacterium]